MTSRTASSPAPGPSSIARRPTARLPAGLPPAGLPRAAAYPSDVSLYTIAEPGSPGDPGDLISPSLVAAFDGWVDAGSAATTALAQLIDGAPAIVRFDSDQLFDYRARRPTLEIIDGRLHELTWPELAIKRTRVGDRDLLVLAGPEPDD